ncbi:MAG TPA: tryptophan synthase subunit alpha, partial [Cytophagaceae bacterium]
FEQLEGVRNEVQIPILLMGYVNTVMQYGIENFCRKAAEVGVDGVILPDLPMDEYNEFYKQVFENNNLSNVFLVTPNTSDKRLKLIDESTQGFIYVVSTDSTTGNNKGLSGAEDYFKRIKNSNLKNPYLIGFNIKDRETFCLASKYAHGAIIGSAFIKAIKDSKNLKEDIYKFVEGIKKD